MRQEARCLDRERTTTMLTGTSTDRGVGRSQKPNDLLVASVSQVSQRLRRLQQLGLGGSLSDGFTTHQGAILDPPLTPTPSDLDCRLL